ncbi:hypothetical protein [Streptomyces sp. AN091965]|uniref:hypothetical protein n=1 Tax=Streptomyces sp. AN091965 TaxID=2927803 RepID=UPI001F60A4EB|nr:hypothetical protein [Streptomyces sp. AN091965]MCI3935100.1 hypothetical protein [Streptomyces sp. AN091965]
MRIAKSAKVTAATAAAAAAAVIGLSAPAGATGDDDVRTSGLGKDRIVANSAASIDNENEVLNALGYTWSN